MNAIRPDVREPLERLRQEREAADLVEKVLKNQRALDLLTRLLRLDVQFSLGVEASDDEVVAALTEVLDGRNERIGGLVQGCQIRGLHVDEAAVRRVLESRPEFATESRGWWRLKAKGGA